jgi:hypothetical protein
MVNYHLVAVSLSHAALFQPAAALAVKLDLYFAAPLDLECMAT